MERCGFADGNGKPYEFVGLTEARQHFNKIARACAEDGRPTVVVKGNRPYVLILPIGEDGRPAGAPRGGGRADEEGGG